MAVVTAFAAQLPVRDTHRLFAFVVAILDVGNEIILFNLGQKVVGSQIDALADLLSFECQCGTNQTVAIGQLKPENGIRYLAQQAAQMPGSGKAGLSVCPQQIRV
jgi:hypothetical protein